VGLACCVTSGSSHAGRRRVNHRPTRQLVEAHRSCSALTSSIHHRLTLVVQRDSFPTLRVLTDLTRVHPLSFLVLASLARQTAVVVGRHALVASAAAGASCALLHRVDVQFSW